MLNGLIIKDLSERNIRDGVESGKYLPSDFVTDEDGYWIHLKDTPFIKSKKKNMNGWIALFTLSFILNIIMVVLMFWQKSRIEQLLN